MITSRTPQWPTRFARMAGGLVFAIGITVLSGWALDIPVLKSILPGWASMVPVTALNFVLSGIALRLLAGASRETGIPAAGSTAMLCAGIVAFAGLFRLGCHVAQWNPGIDHLWFHPMPGLNGRPGSMSPATSLDFLLLGCALLLAPCPRAIGLFQFTAMAGWLVGWLGFSRYLYGGQPLIPLAQMAAHTALGFLVLSTGILCTRREGGLLSLLLSGSTGGVIARRLMPPAILAPLLLGWLWLRAQNAGWFAMEAGVALFAVTNVIVFVAFVWITGALLRRVDAGRGQAQEVRARFAEIVESSDDAIIGKTLEGIITSWNRGAEQIFGYTAGEIVGKPMLTLFPPELAGEEADILWRLSHGERIDHYETVRIRKDGRRVDVSVTTSPIKDASGRITGVSKIARDITLQKQAEKKAAWLASFPARNPNPIVEFELETGAIRYINPIAGRLFPDLETLGLRHPWLAGLREAARDFTTEKTEALRREVIAGESCYSQTVSHIAEAGCVRVYGTDITKRKRAEQRLQSQFERLNLLHKITRATGERQDLKSIFQVVIRSVEDNLPVDFCCICLYDPVAKELTVSGTGLRSSMLAMEMAMTEQAIIPIDENGLSRCVQGQLVYEADIAQIPFPFPQRLARTGLRSLVVAPLLVESNVFGVLVAARGKSEGFSSGECEFLRQLSEHTALAAHQAQLYGALRQAYNDLRQSQQTVMQQERLRALGQMASGIAHDINNAISPASLYAESLLENEPGLSARARDYLGTIQNALEDVAETVARMREFYRQREPQMTLERVDLNRMAAQVINLTRARWSGIPQQKGVVIAMQEELAPDLPQVMGVESEIREALINLIFNAADAMPGGGTLTLRTYAADTPPESAPGLRVNVEVCDTGTGMSEDTRNRCMEPFFTTKGERGTGLGLAMVYGVVQRHGAEIDVQSAPGKGTLIRLSFPVAPAPGAEPSVSDPEPFTVPSRLRILTVDDDPVVIKSLQDTLETDGHIVTSASDGQEGIDAFRKAMEGNAPFAVVITDLGMPYVDGRKVASEVKSMSPATPVILLTGWGQRLVAEGDVPAHVDCVLNKPPKLRALREALARCVAGK